jgi:hypothetical protein
MQKIKKIIPLLFCFVFFVKQPTYSQLDPNKYPPTRETMKYFAPKEPTPQLVTDFWHWVDKMLGIKSK